ncbi:arsenate reductase (glutaredoxin) [Legionella sp. MW5194]|uniref:arsenate reductase (glutaredoxin) n=1 Tax=Legionella sp. MW5194 TaxID=2662448 RepID=UPI00193DBEEC|nr:arsenate reductase (glutaredoxin) [Legionella sp. MW5194]QRN02584.1 arsenate reductase (glutaredoxin) [Legionella sp. MW5194]
METITIYHNPRCSKSRETLKLLHDKGLKPVIVEYLKRPLSLEQLRALSTHFELKDFVRSGETIFKEWGLSLSDKEKLLSAMHKAPVLMQRPIVTYRGKAVIGRPPEKVLTLLNERWAD